jgi:formiminotetrahydrofolate cyclodeaminase
MKLIELSISDFVNEVDSKKPAPGGGSVSALVSLLGLSLARMVGHLSISKKSFEKLPIVVQDEFLAVMSDFEVQKQALLNLIDEDTLAFNQMMIAYKMPKVTDLEVLLRNNAIELATINGIEVPLQVVTNSIQVLRKVEFFIENGVSSALSDVGVGVLLLSSGLEGAILNMKINLSGISNESTKEKYKTKIQNLMDEKETIVRKLMEIIHSKLN